MLTLQDMKKAIDQLSPEERRELREYLDQRESTEHAIRTLTAEERIQQMDSAVKAIREGMTQAELNVMIDDMNAEYIEPVDLDEWKD
jgi:uncharacterized protein YeeX (DUF496 family)